MIVQVAVAVIAQVRPVLAPFRYSVIVIVLVGADENVNVAVVSVPDEATVVLLQVLTFVFEHEVESET